MKYIIMLVIVGFTLITQPRLVGSQSITPTKCEQDLAKTKEVIVIQQREIEILEEELLIEKKKAEVLQEKNDSKTTWLWILPPLALLVGILGGQNL